ncbi:MAG TPA: DoxX family protein [Mycobacteriales bacterium]|nr:DoxX family protein [Mycobacteriales bacterium]
MAEGLFIIRAVIGGLLFAHGTQKLFGWYGGYGLDGTGGFFESVGHRPGRTMAMVAGICEAGGGLLLLMGLLTPIGSAAIVGTMIVAAVSVHKDNGLWATNGGYELPLINATVAAALAFTGAGKWSLDSALNTPWNRGWGVGLLAICVAFLAAGAVLARRNKVVTGEATSEADAYPEADVAADPATAQSPQHADNVTS